VPIYGFLDKRTFNDQLKQQLSAEVGVTLISIPFWWDKTEESLLATLKKYLLDVGYRSLQRNIPPRFTYCSGCRCEAYRKHHT
jgi:hypothetical protein